MELRRNSIFAKRVRTNKVYILRVLVKNKDNRQRRIESKTEWFLDTMTVCSTRATSSLFTVCWQPRSTSSHVCEPKTNRFSPWKTIFFFSNSCLAQSSLALMFVRKKNKLKLNEFRPFFLFFFSVLSFIFLETSSYQSDILCPEKHVYLWRGICTERKKLSMVSFASQEKKNMLCTCNCEQKLLTEYSVCLLLKTLCFEAGKYYFF